MSIVVAEDKLLRSACSVELTTFELSGEVLGCVEVVFGTVRVVSFKLTFGVGVFVTVVFSTGALSTDVKSGFTVSFTGLTGSTFSGVGAGVGGVTTGAGGVG